MLAYNTGADLDAPPSDRQWSELSASRDGGGADLWSLYPDLAGINGATVVTIDSGTSTACQNATGWLTPNSFQDLNLGVGSFLCVRTSQGRYSLLTVTAIDTTTNTITFSVKTFKKLGDLTNTSPTATISTPAAVSGGIYHQGPLKLAYNTGADLDAPPSDRQWSELSASRDGGGADLWSLYPDLAGINGATVVTIDSGTSTACQNATGWLTPNSFQDLNLGVGSFLCVRTSQGRYSLLTVTAIDTTTNTITFSVKTFKKLGD